MNSKKMISWMVYLILCVGIAQPVSAQVSETGGKKQSPVQVMTTIGITAVVMKGLSYLRIP